MCYHQVSVTALAHFLGILIPDPQFRSYPIHLRNKLLPALGDGHVLHIFFRSSQYAW